MRNAQALRAWPRHHADWGKRCAVAGLLGGREPCAVSRTVRLTQPLTEIGSGPWSRPSVMVRSREGLRPNTPLHEAGMRIEPPPSLACAIGTTRAATATAAPPEEPPQERADVPRILGRPAEQRFGRRRQPELWRRGFAERHHARKPGSRRCMAAALAATLLAKARLPNLSGRPASGSKSLIKVGTPANGPAERRRGAGAAIIVGGCREEIELRIDPIRARDGCFQRFRGSDLPAADARRDADGVESPQARPSPPPWACMRSSPRAAAPCASAERREISVAMELSPFCPCFARARERQSSAKACLLGQRAGGGGHGPRPRRPPAGRPRFGGKPRQSARCDRGRRGAC